MTLEGRTALVTGGGRGIGLAYLERLAADGANVIAVDVNDPTDAISGLAGLGEKMALRCDVSDPEQVDAAVTAVLARFGRVDILVNNAAIFPTTDLESVAIETWRRVQAVNVEPIVRLAQAFVPAMKANGWGRIVNTGSANTLLGNRDLAYMTSKAGVHGLTRALANELGDSNITVNAIAPSIVSTDGFLDRDRDNGPTTDQILERVTVMQAIKRPSIPSDLANALSFLVSNDADFITGQILHIDGGLTRSGA